MWQASGLQWQAAHKKLTVWNDFTDCGLVGTPDNQVYV